MEKRARHRPERSYPEAKRQIFVSALDTCVHCGAELKLRPNWHVRKTIQTMQGPLFLAGRAKVCPNVECTHGGTRYYASQVLLLSLPNSTYGLDVLAYIGWRHEHEHKQLLEIQHELNGSGLLVNNRTVGRLYRQFLALLGAMQMPMKQKLEETVKQHGGLIWAIDALEPEGCGSMLYVLYEVLSSMPVAAIQVEHVTAVELAAWLKPYQDLPYPVLATLSDGEETIAAAFKLCWSDAPHQRCQSHFLGNLAEEVLKEDTQLRQSLRDDLGGLPAVPKHAAGEDKAFF